MSIGDRRHGRKRERWTKKAKVSFLFIINRREVGVDVVVFIFIFNLFALKLWPWPWLWRSSSSSRSLPRRFDAIAAAPQPLQRSMYRSVNAGHAIGASACFNRALSALTTSRRSCF
jgi:hypothetical protein